MSYVQEFADFVLNKQDLYSKGYDGFDEELSDSEVDFSDDEKEAEYCAPLGVSVIIAIVILLVLAMFYRQSAMPAVTEETAEKRLRIKSAPAFWTEKTRSVAGRATDRARGRALGDALRGNSWKRGREEDPLPRRLQAGGRTESLETRERFRTVSDGRAGFGAPAADTSTDRW